MSDLPTPWAPPGPWLTGAGGGPWAGLLRRSQGRLRSEEEAAAPRVVCPWLRRVSALRAFQSFIYLFLQDAGCGWHVDSTRPWTDTHSFHIPHTRCPQKLLPPPRIEPMFLASDKTGWGRGGGEAGVEPVGSKSPRRALDRLACHLKGISKGERLRAGATRDQFSPTQSYSLSFWKVPRSHTLATGPELSGWTLPFRPRGHVLSRGLPSVGAVRRRPSWPEHEQDGTSCSPSSAPHLGGHSGSAVARLQSRDITRRLC